MLTANSTEQQGMEMVAIVVESPISSANSTQQQGVEMLATVVESAGKESWETAAESGVWTLSSFLGAVEMLFE
uniref:Uncharacterized protein n=1 Tax=Fagus sylvatica TaxID=28930 RepID=A0A2N9GG40_FAGSY